MILLVLYATFLSNIYRDSFLLGAGEASGLIKDKVLDGLVGGQLFASLLAVSCVTVSVCSNMLMVQDRANGCANDLLITPVKSSIMALGYYISTLLTTLLICFSACAVCFIYLAVVGWFMSFVDVILILIDVIILVVFGTALSSVINFFLSSQGQISAVGTIISSTYGFICGAYMPISNFSDGLQKVVSFFPGTYGTALIKNHALKGVFKQMSADGVPEVVIESMKSAVDCHVNFFGNKVEVWATYLIMILTDLILIGGYILLCKYCKRKKAKKVKSK